MQASLIKDPLVSRYRVKNKRITGQMHYHNEYEFYYLVEGKSTYIIDGEIYPIEKGDFVFVPKNVLHMTDSLNSQKVMERFLLCFDDSVFSDKNRYLLDALMETRIIHIPNTILPKIENIIAKIETEYKQDNVGKEAILDIYILELLIMIHRHRYKKKTIVRESDRIIYDVSDYIMLHYAEDLSLKNISKLFNISESYLSRKFKEITGLCINQYITYIRISNAEKLLENSSHSITQIADECGFCGSTYFSSVFKKFKGVAPLTYRKQKN